MDKKISVLHRCNERLEFAYTPSTTRTTFFISDYFTGRIQVKDKIENPEKTVVDISNLSSGIYLLCVIDGDNRIEIKFDKSN